MRMPAMSPTMTEGGITSWKKEEGESFTTGDVLLEVVRLTPLHPSNAYGSIFTQTLADMRRQETDKATIDVEAQDDGVMGKIIVRLSSYLCHEPCGKETSLKKA